MQMKIGKLKFPPTVAKRLKEFSERDRVDARAAQDL